MPSSKRARACDNCHSIKIKCELGSIIGSSGPCSRCARLKKQCTVTPPKRQKDRVAELEAQVEALTKQLASQHIQSAAVDSSLDDNAMAKPIAATSISPFPQKKRRLEEEAWSGARQASGRLSGAAFDLDAIVSSVTQQQLVKLYMAIIVPIFPLVPLEGELDWGSLRRDRPILLQAIVYVACPGVLSIDTQEEVGKVVMDLFASEAMAESEKSIDFLQAMLLAVCWYRAPKHHTHVAAFQLIQLAAGVAEDLELSGPNCSPWLSSPSHHKQVDTVEVWRTWLGSKMLSMAMATFTRRPSPPVWAQHDESSLMMLEYTQNGLPGDRLLCQFVRAERLFLQIVCRNDVHNFSAFDDVASTVTQTTTPGLQNTVTDWKAQIPPTLRTPALKFFEHVATLYLHESVLHTETNKHSFAAPYLSERLSVTDFPRPLVTQGHVTSLLALQKACHALIDLVSTLDVSLLMALPAMLFGARVAFTNYLLVKLYIATTGPGNTFGAFHDPGCLQVDCYLGKIMEVAARVKKVDESCGSARVLSSASRLQEWFLNYIGTHNDQSANIDVDSGMAPPVTDMDPPSMVGQVPFDWNGLSFENDLFGLGLEELFAEPPSGHWYPEPLQDSGFYASTA
ncbi:hypothetical protein LTR37_006686 [Vermiconidia calcicola]|uniref:Uncharacterized protein n=1 Tax=Vermiconidia calcicola TaxID=1690605 RepID=A0ACC3NI83_9PEZI|nr:hypothetical protein LTR37_006686 [Vermiconidia calcicola]